VAIPDRIQRLKRVHPEVARAWHRVLRRFLSLALSSGGEVSDVRRHRRGASIHDYYVLTRRREAPAGGAVPVATSRRRASSVRDPDSGRRRR
jgi:predicted GNAT superfamily acetyltransferase